MATIFRPPLVTRILPPPRQQPDELHNLLLTTLRSQDRFFGVPGSPLEDWPNPRGPAWTADLRQGLQGSVRLTLLGKDLFYGGPGCGPDYDWPNPRGAVWTNDLRGGFAGPIALNLLGRDRFFSGAGCGPDYDWPNPAPRPPAFPSATAQPVPNLLGTTLARPVGHADDQPNPRGPVWANEVRGGFVNPTEIQLSGQDRFFGLAGAPQFDWPNPRGPLWPADVRSGSVGPVNPNLLSQDQFFGGAGKSPAYDWPNPTLRVPPFVALAAQAPLNLLEGPLAAPVGRLLDWPNPRGAVWANDVRQGFAGPVNLLLRGRDTFFGPAGQGPDYDWPNPRGPRPLPANEPVPNPLVTTLAAPPGTPKFLTDWPNPRGAGWANEVRGGFTAGVRLALLGRDLFFAAAGEAPRYDWPNPAATRRPAADAAGLGLLVTTLAAAVGFPVGRCAEWPNPPRQRGPAAWLPGGHGRPANLLGASGLLLTLRRRTLR